MHTATGITLIFVAATAVLAALNNLKIGEATRRWDYLLGACTSAVMAVWCGYLALWTFTHL